MSCSECGIGQIVEDDYGAEIALVCDNCGCMQKNTLCESLVSTPNPNFETVALQKKYRTNLDQHVMRYLPACKKEMNACIDKFSNDNEAIKKNAHDLFVKMMQVPAGTGFSRRRSLLSAACVYSALKQFEIPVSIHAITSQMGTTSTKIHRVLTQIKKALGGDGPRPPIEEEVKLALNNLPIVKNGEKMAEKAMQLYSLLDRFSLVDGRTPTAVAAVCAYFTFASKDKLPFVEPSTVTERNYHLHIDHILRYRDALIFNYDEKENPKTDVMSLCTPPCLFRDMKYPPANHTPEASTSEILCEEDLPESEIGLYLRTTDEVSKVENINQLLQSDAGESENRAS